MVLAIRRFFLSAGSSSLSKRLLCSGSSAGTRFVAVTVIILIGFVSTQFLFISSIATGITSDAKSDAFGIGC